MLKYAPRLSWPAVGFWLGKHKFGLPGHLVGSFPQLAKKKSERSLCDGWHNAIPEESQLVCAIVACNHPVTNLGQFLITEAGQLGDTQPIGSPISWVTH
jgi:hypothetical protein